MLTRRHYEAHRLAVWVISLGSSVVACQTTAVPADPAQPPPTVELARPPSPMEALAGGGAAVRPDGSEAVRPDGSDQSSDAGMERLPMEDKNPDRAAAAAQPLPPLPSTRAARLQQTVESLSALGEKRAGTPAGQRAGDYILQRLTRAGLRDVHGETFQFPFFNQQGVELEVSIDGQALPLTVEVFAYSGVGAFDARVVCVGSGAELDYTGVDAAGAVVVVERNPQFHRTSQYRLAAERGGVAMVYISAAPDDLIQTGTVRMAQERLGPIPALTVPASVGEKLKQACSSGVPVRARGRVDAILEARVGRNILGTIAGSQTDAPQILVGAHYDTWHMGAADNVAGVAAMLELADTLASSADRRNLSVVFVGYDAEEIGLLGGYDFVRKHMVHKRDPIVAFVHFEGPAVAAEGGNKVLAYTSGGPILDSITASASDQLYPLTVGMELLPAVLGGVIPTDVQGLYRYGVQGVTTACDTPWYHTREDTPDKIDFAFLAGVVDRFEVMLTQLDQQMRASFEQHDPALWRLQVSSERRADGLRLSVQVTDANGGAQTGANVQAWLAVDDFTKAWEQTVQTASAGAVSLLVPDSALRQGAGNRYVHVSAGGDYPLAEHILALP